MKKILKVLIISLLLVTSVTGCASKEEQVSNQMKKYLYEKYGKEFEVDRIGLRSDNRGKFYQARIYPKSIIGTPQENDDYYYGNSSVRVNLLGIISKDTGDDYSFINRNDDVENYLLPKVKELFGEKVRVRVEVQHEKTAKLDYEVADEERLWIGYKSDSLKEMREDIAKNPKTARIVLELKIFVFDKIDNKEEEETRKKQLFEFLQYLRKEKLDKYLSVDCNFMDDIVLAPSFEENRYILEKTEDKKEKKEIENKLREEVKKLSEKEFLDNMNSILKSEFDYTNGDLAEYMIEIVQILTINYMKEIDVYGAYEDAVEKNELEKHKYKDKKDFDYWSFKDYIFYKGVE